LLVSLRSIQIARSFAVCPALASGGRHACWQDGDDRERYTSAASVQALAGASPVTYESGKYARAHRRQACIKSLRNTLYQFAWQSTAAEPWATTYYRRKRREGKSHSMAVRALANCWVRIIHAMWLTHTVYRSDIFLAAQQAHASPAA
jgi:transposase